MVNTGWKKLLQPGSFSFFESKCEKWMHLLKAHFSRRNFVYLQTFLSSDS